MDYDSYQLMDFVTDPGFRDWVLETDPAAVAFWENWRLSHPSKHNLIKEASQIVRVLEQSQKPLSPEEIQSRWKSLQPLLFRTNIPPDEWDPSWTLQIKEAI